MKNAILLVNIAVLLALTTAGCDDEVESLSTDSSAVDRVRAGDLTFTLQILNMQGEPQTQFEEGENFQFQFIIENKGTDVYTLPVEWYFPITNPEFFVLHRRTEESSGIANLGKPFQPELSTNDATPQSVPANSSIIYTTPWFTQRDTSFTMPTYRPDEVDLELIRKYMPIDSQAVVSKGEYFTGFTIQYNDNDSVRLETSFIVN